MRKNIEATILASMIDADYYDGESEKAFKVDAEVFSNDAFKYIASQINRAIDAGMPLSLLGEKLGDALHGTAHELDYLFMEGRVHLALNVVKRYYDDLVKTHRKNLMKGIV